MYLGIYVCIYAAQSGTFGTPRPQSLPSSMCMYVYAYVYSLASRDEPSNQQQRSECPRVSTKLTSNQELYKNKNNLKENRSKLQIF